MLVQRDTRLCISFSLSFSPHPQDIDIMPNYGSINEEKVVLLEEGDYETRQHAQRTQRRSSVVASSVGNMLRSSLMLSGPRCSMRDMQGKSSVPNQIVNLTKNIVVCILTIVHGHGTCRFLTLVCVLDRAAVCWLFLVACKCLNNLTI